MKKLRLFHFLPLEKSSICSLICTEFSAKIGIKGVLCILDTETGKSTPISSRFGPAEKASVWQR